MYWALELIAVPYFVGEGKFADISADSANAHLKMITNRDSLDTGRNWGYSSAGCWGKCVGLTKKTG